MGGVMRPTNRNRKRPCRICGKWFSPNPRLGERQKTCGDKECQRKWHAKKCREWNRKNLPYFQEIYLERCLASCETPRGQVTTKLSNAVIPASLPATSVQEVINLQQLVIIRYLLRQPNRRFQEVIEGQGSGITINQRRLLIIPISRDNRGTGAKPVS